MSYEPGLAQPQPEHNVKAVTCRTEERETAEAVTVSCDLLWLSGKQLKLVDSRNKAATLSSMLSWLLGSLAFGHPEETKPNFAGFSLCLFLA